MTNMPFVSSTIFDAYRNLLCAQFAFVQKAMQANAGMWTAWSKTFGTLEVERLSVTAIQPEVMTA